MPSKLGVSVGVVVKKVVNGVALLLMPKRSTFIDGGGLWGLPGGKMEPDETWEDCARRELLEETTLKCDTFRQIVWSTDYITSDGETRYVTLFVEALHWSGEPTITEPHKCMDIQWFSESEFVSLESEVFGPLYSVRHLILPD